jgi:hypothetical protein
MKRSREEYITESTLATAPQEIFNPRITSGLLCMPENMIGVILSFLSQSETMKLDRASKTAREVTHLGGVIDWPVHVLFPVNGHIDKRFTNSTDKIHSITEAGRDIKDNLLQFTTLVRLTFGYYFKDPITEGLLPVSLQQLNFGNCFNQPIAQGVLPAGLQQLSFGFRFNRPIAVGVLPGSLQQLTFGNDFNQPIAEGVLPGSLTHLTFGCNFNNPIAEGVLPGRLTYLTFGDGFSHLIAKDVLPKGLKDVTFGKGLPRHKIDQDVLPDSVTRVTVHC